MANFPTTNPCTYHAVTLAEGDSFVLPPGATLISATDTNALTSENGCADDQLANLEQTACYKTTFVDVDEISGHTPPYDVVYIDGIRINGVDYPFTSAFTFQNTWTASAFYTNLVNAINTTSIAPLLTNIVVTNVWLTNGEYFVFTFDAIPSIGGNMIFYGRGGGGHSGGPEFPLQFPVVECSL